jgi:hypothetical protein
VENLPGDARPESRREIYQLNNLAIMIGCERHTVKRSFAHVTGFERNDGAAGAPFFFSWCLPAFFLLSSSYSRQTHHSTSIHTTSNLLTLLFNPPHQILLLSSQWVSKRVRLPTPPTSFSSVQIATLSDSLNQLATLKVAVYGMRMGHRLSYNMMRSSIGSYRKVAGLRWGEDSGRRSGGHSTTS